jgi:hypothetical protein
MRPIFGKKTTTTKTFFVEGFLSQALFIVLQGR